MKILFNLGYFKDNIKVNRDEVHLHMSPPDPLDREIFKPFVLKFKDIHTKQLIRKYTVPAFNQGWQVLSLGKWTNKWVKDPTLNKGILVTIHRGGRKKVADKNPFIHFPTGNDPYMILFASESVQSLMAWRFLIHNALNSVAGNTPSRKTRELSQQLQGGQRVSRDLSQKSMSSQRLTHDLSLQSQARQVRRSTSQRSQCKAVETDMDLANVTVNGRFVVIHPKVYRMINCSNACIMRPARGLFTAPRNNGSSHERYCCMPTKRLDLMVLLKDPSIGVIEAQVLANFVPTGCIWSKQ
jgi:hypothetical protein